MKAFLLTLLDGLKMLFVFAIMVFVIALFGLTLMTTALALTSKAAIGLGGGVFLGACWLACLFVLGLIWQNQPDH